jgi:signal transduction histidine kinase
VLLASRLDAASTLDRRDPVDLLGLAAEEAARVQAAVQGDDVRLQGDERLIRRALRNLLENARRYGGGEVELTVQRLGDRVQKCRCATAARACPRPSASASSSPSSACPAMPRRPAAWAWAWPWCARSPNATAAACAASRAGGGSTFTLTLPLSAPSARA